MKEPPETDAVWLKLPLPPELAKLLRARLETGARLLELLGEFASTAGNAAKDVEADVKAIKRASRRRRRR